MSLRKAVLLLAVVLTASATLTVTAHAQLGAYGTITVNRINGIKGSPVAVGSVVNDNASPIGGTGGVYYDFLKLGPVKLGADLRGTITTTKRGAYTFSNGGGAHLYSGLGGIRAVFHTPFLPLRPYLEASAGIGRTDYGLLYSTGVTIRNNFQYMGYAGLDITLLPIMDLRLVEFGYGGLNPMGANSHNYPIESVSSGLVFHLPF
jgi:hypothetical protein